MQELFKTINSIKQKYDKIMDGKHGIDSLSRDMLILWFVLGFINGFVHSKKLTVISLLLPILSLTRAFSANTVRRTAECRKYLSICGKIKEFANITRKRFSERKTHKYYKCKNCSSYLRVKKKPGKHTVVCPKCGKELHIKISGKE
ncbi:MAG: hypothetical protein IIY78_07795 [Clostridia bacterium]|nr:hypothetical protein [Clostridia bacterium]